MIFVKFMDWFTLYAHNQANRLPAVDTLPALNTLAMLLRWFSSFDTVLPMDVIFFWARLTFGVTAFLTLFQLGLKIKGIFWGAGSS